MSQESQERRGGERSRWLATVPAWIAALTGVAGLVVGGTTAAVVNNYVFEPSTPSSSSSPATGSPSSATPAIYYAGPAGITPTGIDFDSNPPMPGPANVEGTFAGVLSNTDGVLVTNYSGPSSKPSEQECRTWAHSHAATIAHAAQGAQLCIITKRGRTVLFVVTGVVGNSEYDGQATVWNAP